MNRFFWQQRIETQFLSLFAYCILYYCLDNQNTAQAQSIPQTPPTPPTLPQPTPPEPTSPETLPPLPEVITPPTPPDREIPLAPEAIPGKILIKRFEIIGNTVLSEAEIARVIEPYTLRRITFIELLEVPRQITELYVEKGYITSGAVILPQTIKDRVVSIQIIPGTIEEINIIGLKQLKESYIRDRLKQATTAPLNQQKLLAALQLLQIDPLIESVSAELSTGIAVNSSVLTLEIKEADTFTIGLNFDNNRVASVGTFKRQIELNENNVLGIGDRFNIAYTNTDGSDALSNLSYELPINAPDGRLKLTYIYSDNEIVREPFNALDFENETQYYNLSYTHSLSRSIDREINIGLNFTQQISQTTFIDGIPFPDTVGATNSDGETVISTIGFFQDYLQRNERQVFFLRSQFVLGIDALGSVIDEEKPDSEFVAWRGSAEYLQALSNQSTLSIRSNMQLSNDSLAPLEQFTLGGFFSVRGYPQNILLGDNGFTLSTEMRHALLRNRAKNITLEIIPFIDFGKTWNTKTNLGQSVNTLVGIGTGFQLSVGQKLTARIDWGIPLTDVDASGDSLQENGIYFSLRSSF